MTFPTMFQASSVYKNCKYGFFETPRGGGGGGGGWEWPQYSYLSTAKLGLGLSLATYLETYTNKRI